MRQFAREPGFRPRPEKDVPGNRRRGGIRQQPGTKRANARMGLSLTPRAIIFTRLRILSAVAIGSSSEEDDEWAAVPIGDPGPEWDVVVLQRASACA